MFDASAVQFAQPSVTKVGGITEMRKIAALAETAAAAPRPILHILGLVFLRQYIRRRATIKGPSSASIVPRGQLYGDLIDTVDGAFMVPDGPGLGREPDKDVMRDYSVEENRACGLQRWLE